MRDNVVEFFDREQVEAQAREWLIRLDGDAPLKPGEREALRSWATQSAAHREELLRIAAFWNQADLLAELATPQRRPRANWGAGLARIGAVFGSVPRVAIAAALALIVVSAWLVPKVLRSGVESTNGLYATHVGEQRDQALSDGSIVKLNTASEVEVVYSGHSRRLRLLKGEALFKVARDRNRPFDVYAGSSLIRATGTAFSVHIEGEDVTVTVAEGSVALGTVQPGAHAPERAAQASTQNLAHVRAPSVAMLRPLESGQSARLHANTAKVRSLDADDLAQQLAWRDGLLVFMGEPLSEVIDEVSRYTSTRIEIADASLRTLPVGGRFKLGDLDAMLDVLESSFGIQVQRLDDGHIRLLAAPERR